MPSYSQTYLTAARKAKKNGDMLNHHKNMERYYDHRIRMTSSSKEAKSLGDKAVEHRNSWKKIGLGEEAPANAVGGGNIAGAGVGPQGEPAGKLKKPRKRFKAFVKEA